MRRSLMAASAVPLVVVLAALLSGQGAAASTPSGAPADLRDALARNGYVLGSTAPTAALNVSSASAISVAQGQFPTNDPPVVYVGQLTYSGWHVGDESSAVVIENRPVYVVQLTGLDLRPLGGGPGAAPVPASASHHEMIVFVDADSGQFLLATTVR